jgi:hypothetical protein
MGMGINEETSAKAGADMLAADSTAAAQYNNNRFPYEQALSEYGRGMTTGPGTDFKNRMEGYARAWLPGNAFVDSTKSYDALGKWLSQITSSTPGAGRSVEALETTLAGNASTHINELAGEDMMKAGLALQRMNVARATVWNGMSPQEQSAYGGNYQKFAADYGSKADVRAFAFDLYNPAQRKTLAESIAKGTEAEAQRFEHSLNLARQANLVGPPGHPATQQMP